ncbi:hypothetical protein HDU80_003742, partial [Chytriomyces hyalinus]
AYNGPSRGMEHATLIGIFENDHFRTVLKDSQTSLSLTIDGDLNSLATLAKYSFIEGIYSDQANRVKNMTRKLTEKGYKDYICWKPEISMWFAQTLEFVKLRCRQVIAGAIDPDNFPQPYHIHTESELAEGQKQVTCISGSPVEALHNAQLSHTNKRTDFHQTYTPRVKLTTIRMNEGHLAAIEALIKAAGEAVSLSVEDYFNLQFSSAKSIRSMAYNHQHADEQAKRRAKIADDRYNSIVNVDLGKTFVQFKEARIQECYIP